METARLNIARLVLVLLFGALACNLPAAGQEVSTPPIPTATLMTIHPTPTGTLPPVVHAVQPASGIYHESTAHDNEESAIHEYKNVQFGDVFDFNRYERPFTAGTMDYLPHIDIFDFEMTSDSYWYYVDIKMIGKDPAASGVQGTFGIEFDLDIDGRAEILTLVEDPGPGWSTDRVRIYLDGNGDIGGQQSLPDPAYSGDGFDTLLFDSGYGNDPDLAWARAEIKARPVVSFAFKKSLLRNYRKFMWSVFASAGPVDPAKFYFNDTFKEENAGSPNKESEYYPIKDLAAFDNSCRVPTGFKATGFEPLGCQVAVPVVQGDKPEATPGGPVYIWIPLDIDWCQIINCVPAPR